MSIGKLIIDFHKNIFNVLQTNIRKSIPTILYYSKAELGPPKLSEISEIKQGFSNLSSSFKNKSWKNLTVKEAWLKTLIFTEISMWFFLGEFIGRRSLYGYDIKLE